MVFPPVHVQVLCLVAAGILVVMVDFPKTIVQPMSKPAKEHLERFHLLAKVVCGAGYHGQSNKSSIRSALVHCPHAQAHFQLPPPVLVFLRFWLNWPAGPAAAGATSSTIVFDYPVRDVEIWGVIKTRCFEGRSDYHPVLCLLLYTQ